MPKKVSIRYIEEVVGEEISCPYCGHEETIDYNLSVQGFEQGEEHLCEACGKVSIIEGEEWD